MKALVGTFSSIFNIQSESEMNSTNYTSETATLPDSEHRGIIAARTTAAHSWLAGPRLASTRNSDPCPLLRWLCCCLLICCFTRPHFCGHASAFRILQADLCSGNLYYLFDTANTAVKRMQYLHMYRYIHDISNSYFECRSRMYNMLPDITTIWYWISNALYLCRYL